MKKLLLGAASFALPLISFAEPLGVPQAKIDPIQTTTGGTLGTIVRTLGDIVDTLLPIVIGIGVIIFLVGVIKYVLAGDDEEERSKARSIMIYGVIGVFVMVAIWGLVGVLSNTFDIGVGGTAPVPRVEGI